jgi:hypothetical protein
VYTLVYEQSQTMDALAALARSTTGPRFVSLFWIFFCVVIVVAVAVVVVVVVVPQ